MEGRTTLAKRWSWGIVEGRGMGEGLGQAVAGKAAWRGCKSRAPGERQGWNHV